VAVDPVAVDQNESSRPPRNGSTGGRVAKVLAQLVAAALVLALVIGAFIYFQSGHEPAGGGPGGPPGGGQMEPMEVTVVLVQEQAVPVRPRYLGRTEASQEVEIRARVNGFLEARTFEEGGMVTAGQQLYRIDPKPFEAELAVAKARLENARARLERASRQAQRLREAAERGAASPTELDQWETDELVARAEVQLEEARLFQAELELGYTTIESPIDGVIGLSLKDPGTYVQGGPEGLLATVQQQDPLYVTFSVSEQELLNWQQLIAAGKVRLPEGGRVPLRLELANGTVYPELGHLDLIGIQVEPTTGTSLMRGVVPNPERRLLPGQFVRVTAMGIERLGAVLVPQRAVIQSPTGASVYVVTGDGTVQPRPVTLGEWVGDNWIVNEGLRAGDRVVVDRIMMLRPGMPVRIGETLTIRPEVDIEPTPPNSEGGDAQSPTQDR